MAPTFGSLFAGIGGFDLGLERAGWTPRWQCEIDPYCRRVLERHWPDIPRYGDIKRVDWGSVERVDLIAGGFPCQPFSTAGLQRRLADPRWLWPEFARAIRQLGPRYVLVENVPGILVGGGMDAVLGDLAALGYDAEWESIPAAAVGAPHLRWRVWIVAHRPGPRLVADPDGGGLPDLQTGGLGNGRDATRAPQSDVGPGGHDVPSDMADPDQGGWTGRPRDLPGQDRRDEPPNGGRPGSPDVPDPLGQRGCGGPPGIENATDAGQRSPGEGDGWWDVEPNVGRVANGVSGRVDRLRALGNAVVPQVVEFIGRGILDAEMRTGIDGGGSLSASRSTQYREGENA